MKATSCKVRPTPLAYRIPQVAAMRDGYGPIHVCRIGRLALPCVMLLGPYHPNVEDCLDIAQSAQPFSAGQLKDLTGVQSVSDSLGNYPDKFWLMLNAVTAFAAAQGITVSVSDWSRIKSNFPAIISGLTLDLITVSALRSRNLLAFKSL